MAAAKGSMSSGSSRRLPSTSRFPACERWKASTSHCAAKVTRVTFARPQCGSKDFSSMRVRLAGRHYRVYPKHESLGYAEKDLALSPSDTAFLLCDVYGLGYDEGDQDVHSDWEGLVSGQSTSREGEIVHNAIRPALDAARAVGFPIVYGQQQRAADRSQAVGVRRAEVGDAARRQGRDLCRTDRRPARVPRRSVECPHLLPGDRPPGGGLLHPEACPQRILRHPSRYAATQSGCAEPRLRRNCPRCLPGQHDDRCTLANYRVLLLRDCTYAIEIPGIDEPGAWTKRWILYTECAIGCTATSQAWQDACYGALETESRTAGKPIGDGTA